MPPIPAEQDDRGAEEGGRGVRAQRATPTCPGPFVPLLRSPEVMTRARAMGDYLRFKSVLPPRLSEFAILITARQWTQQYEWDAHHALAHRRRVSSPAIAQALAEGRRPERMAEDEEILYDFCIELHHNQSVSDATYQRAVAKIRRAGRHRHRSAFSGYYTLLAMVMNTARTPLPAGRTPGLPRRFLVELARAYGVGTLATCRDWDHEFPFAVARLRHSGIRLLDHDDRRRAFFRRCCCCSSAAAAPRSSTKSSGSSCSSSSSDRRPCRWASCSARSWAACASAACCCRGT